ncbi:MAG: hypothetical protein NTX50_16615, partial [Candidatus Sumerlaeota bacterium]|nr:hypothetical protein [Candidatus Sumerlaeota bacterium]
GGSAMDSRPAPPPSPAGPPPRKHRIRRFFLRLFAYMLLILLGAVALLWFVPVHSRWLDRQVKEALEGALGVKAQFDPGSYYFCQGVFKFDNLVLTPLGDEASSATYAAKSDAGAGGTPIKREAGEEGRVTALGSECAVASEDGRAPRLSCRRAEVQFAIWELFSRSRRSIESLHLFEPATMDFAISGGTISIPQPISSLAASIQRKGAAPNAPAFRLKRLLIENASANLTLPGGAGQSPGVVRLEAIQADIHYRFHSEEEIGDEDILDVSLYGSDINHRPDRWRASLRYAVESERLTFDVFLSEATAPLTWEDGAKRTLFLTRPRFAGMFQRQTRRQGEWSGAVEMKAIEAQVLDSGGVKFTGDTDVSVAADWEWRSDKQLLEVRRLSVTGDQTDMRAQGDCRVGEGGAWKASLSVYRIPGAVFRRIAGQLRVPGGVKISERARLRAEFDLEGKLDPFAARILMASGQLNDLKGGYSNLFLEMRDGTLDAQYTPEQLTLREVSGAVDGGRFSMSGTMKGDALGSGPLTGEFFFRANVDLRQFLAAKGLGDILNAQNIGLTGQMSILGRLTQEIHRASSGHWDFSRPQVQADATLTSAAFRHPSLPYPIEQINGTFSSKGDSLLTNDLIGRLGTMKANLSGGIRGDSYFWVRPRMDLKIGSQLGVSELLAILPERERAEAARWKPRGKTSGEGSITGPMLSPKDWQAGVTIRLQDVGFQPDWEDFAAPFSDISGVLAYDGAARRFRVENLRGLAGGIPFECQGSIFQKQVALNLTGRANLKRVQRLAPRYLHSCDVDGDVAFEACLRTRSPFTGWKPDWKRPEISMAALNLDGMLAQLQTAQEIGTAPAGDEAEATASTSPALWIRMRSDGARFTYESMPADVTNLRGELYYVDGVFYARNVLGDFGRIKDVAIHRFAAIFPEKRQLRMWFEMEHKNADVTEWLQSWRRRPRGSALELPEALRPPHVSGSADSDEWTIDIGGAFQVGKAHWRIYEADDLTAQVSYRHAPGQTTVIRADARALAYSGQTTAVVEISKDDADEYRWQARGVGKSIQLQPLLANFRVGSGKGLAGEISGFMEFKGTGADWASMEGAGHLYSDQLQFQENRLLTQLGQALNSGGRFKKVTFDQAAAGFECRNRRIAVPEFALAGEAMELTAAGSVDFDRKIDAIVTVNLLKGVGGFLDDVPVIGWVAQGVKRVARPVSDAVGKAFRARVEGTLDSPSVSIEPFADTVTGIERATPDRTMLKDFTKPASDTLSIRIPNLRRPE